MHKPTKPLNDQQKTHAPRILTESELQRATGGDEVAVSNVLKTRHDTIKNTIGN